jgi:uncharacterized protein (TIGR00159 family)
MPRLAIIANLHIQDILDILLLTAVAYHLHRWFWGTKAFKALVGLLALGAVYTAARFWGLFLTTWVFQILWQVLVVMLIILFQSEIRQVLERFNPLRVLGLRAFSKNEEWVPNFVETVFSLAHRKIGALIIFERMDRVEEWATAGIPMDAEPGSQLLMSIFQKESPLHDGAMLIRRGRIAQAACYLPLTSSEGLPKEWGTRHRAALGLCERCDAWVLVVSEERGEISLARGGRMGVVGSTEQLARLVREALAPPRLQRMTWWTRVRSFVTYRWHVKLGSFGIVALLWLLLAGQQDFEATIRVPLEVKNFPAKMKILEPIKPEVHIKVRGLRKDASILTERNVHAAIDLSMARFGRTIFRIARDQIALPNDRIQVVNIQPPEVEFTFEEEKP